MQDSSENLPPFKKGDVVQLLSGGPMMTVTRLVQGSLNSPDEWTCSLIYTDNHGIIQREKSIEACLLQLNGWAGDNSVSSGG